MGGLHLLPAPKSMSQGAGTFRVAGAAWIVLEGEAAELFAAQRLARQLEGATGVAWKVVRAAGAAQAARTGRGGSGAGDVRCVTDAGIRHEQGYRLTIRGDGPGRRGSVELRARTGAGMFYAMQTLAQMAWEAGAGGARRGAAWEAVTIEDEPDFLRRGVYLDCARGKVPELGTLLQLVDDLAGLKINEFQLYVENAFEFRRHPEMYDDTTPLTAEELLILDEACRRRHIDFVPSLTSLGHFEKILSRPAFRELAEAEPAELRAMGVRVWCEAPWSLCVTDGKAKRLLRDMYDEYLPQFSSRYFNICCDEAYDLGRGRSRKAAERLGEGAAGRGRLYVDWVRYCAGLARGQGKRIMMWADIMEGHPELLGRLPGDATLIEWGYEAGHDFEGWCAALARAGKRFYVAPGTSSWMTLASRTKNALENMQRAAMAGRRHGAAGFLITDWGDFGHQQLLGVSLLGFAYGAGVSWNVDRARTGAAERRAFLAAASTHMFRDPAGGFAELAYDLGLTYERLGWQRKNASLEWFLLREKFNERKYLDRVRETGLRRAERTVRRALAKLEGARLGHVDGELIRAEFLLTGREILHGIERTRLRKAVLGTPVAEGSRRGATKTVRTSVSPPYRATARRLRREVLELREEFEGLWLARNKRSRLADVTTEFTRCAREYAAVATRRRVMR